MVLHTFTVRLTTFPVWQISVDIVLSRWGGCAWLKKMSFGLDDWIYCTSYIHTTRNYRQYSTIAILHILLFTVTQALGFSIFTSRILATELQQSQCHLSHIWSPFFHSLTPFFLFSQTHILAGWRPETRLSCNHISRTPRKRQAVLLTEAVYRALV
jgi:hypothetical protein